MFTSNSQLNFEYNEAPKVVDRLNGFDPVRSTVDQNQRVVFKIMMNQ